jgi:hypothetical protein
MIFPRNEQEVSDPAAQRRRVFFGIPVTFKMQYAELTALRKPRSRLNRRLAAVYGAASKSAGRRRFR